MVLSDKVEWFWGHEARNQTIKKWRQSMKRRKWDSKTKFRIVLEGFKGRAISEICNEYQISQAQYYKWRDHFLTFGQKTFEVAQATSIEKRLNRENLKLKTLVGELTMEVKKTDTLLDNL